jgi:hypothetical protein
MQKANSDLQARIDDLTTAAVTASDSASALLTLEQENTRLAEELSAC